MISAISTRLATPTKGRNVFEVLEEAGLVSRGKPNRRVIASLPLSRIIDIADAISDPLSSTDSHRIASPYVHSASLGLGGAPVECHDSRCRLQKIGTLARFAGLYSDGVMVHNFFADYASVNGHPPDQDSDDFRTRVTDDINVALSVRPLVEAGLIRFFSPKILQNSSHICMECLAQRIFGAPGHRRFKKSFDRLSKKYLDSLSVEAYCEDDIYHLVCSVSEELHEHDNLVLVTESSKILSNIPSVLSQVVRGKHVQLSRKACQRIGIHRDLASVPIQSVIYHAAVTKLLSTSFLTHRQLDIDLLHAIGSDTTTQNRNKILFDNFQLMLPFADGVPIKKLLKLRQREEEAFIRFQASINRVVAEASSLKGDITDRDARNLYGDFIRPRLAELDQKIKEAKRDLVRHPAASLAGTAAVLGFGFFSGLLAAELQAIVGALGAFKTVHDLTATTVQLSDVKKAIRHDDMYFLWRVRNLS